MNPDVKNLIDQMADYIHDMVEEEGFVTKSEAREKLRELIFGGDDPIDTAPFKQPTITYTSDNEKDAVEEKKFTMELESDNDSHK